PRRPRPLLRTRPPARPTPPIRLNAARLGPRGAAPSRPRLAGRVSPPPPPPPRKERHVPSRTGGGQPPPGWGQPQLPGWAPLVDHGPRSLHAARWVGRRWWPILAVGGFQAGVLPVLTR